MKEVIQSGKNAKGIIYSFLFWSVLLIFSSCTQQNTDSKVTKTVTAETILGDSTYQAISYGGYRAKSRDIQPTIAELKEDMLLLSAVGIKLIRTYNVTRPHASNVLKAISELKKENEGFEMYVMLCAWINCKNAWTDKEPNHDEESPANASEIDRAAKLANQY